MNTCPKKERMFAHGGLEMHSEGYEVTDKVHYNFRTVCRACLDKSLSSVPWPSITSMTIGQPACVWTTAGGARGTYKVNWSQVQQINKRSFDWQGREGVGFPEIPCSESLSWGPAITWSGLGLTDFLGEELILSFAMGHGLSSSCWLFMKMIYFISMFIASSHPRFLSLPRLGLSGIILQTFIEYDF